MFPGRRKMIIIHVIIVDFPTFSYKPKFIGREKSVWRSASLAVSNFLSISFTGSCDTYDSL